MALYVSEFIKLIEVVGAPLTAIGPPPTAYAPGTTVATAVQPEEIAVSVHLGSIEGTVVTAAPVFGSYPVFMTRLFVRQQLCAMDLLLAAIKKINANKISNVLMRVQKYFMSFVVRRISTTSFMRNKLNDEKKLQV